MREVCVVGSHQIEVAGAFQRPAFSDEKEIHDLSMASTVRHATPIFDQSCTAALSMQAFGSEARFLQIELALQLATRLIAQLRRRATARSSACARRAKPRRAA